MDIIGHLVRTVTPAVLTDNRTPQNESLLEQFYAIFAARLADENTAHFQDKDIALDDDMFFERVWTSHTNRENIISELAATNNVDKGVSKSLVLAAAPLAYNELKNLSGDTSLPTFLGEHLSTYRDYIPDWAMAMLSAVLPAGFFAEKTSQEAKPVSKPAAAPVNNEPEQNGGFLKALLPIIGLIILGALAWALLRGCQDKPQPIAAPVDQVEQPAEDVAEGDATEEDAAVEELKPAILNLSSNDSNGLEACSMTAGDDGLASSLVSSIKSVFSDDADKCAPNIQGGFATDMPATKHLAGILPIVKTSPNADVAIQGDTIRVSTPDDAQTAKLVSDLQAAAPDMTVTAGNAGIKPAVLSLSSNDKGGLVKCEMSAGNNALGSSLLEKIKSIFSDDIEKCESNIDSGFAADMPADEHLGAILPLIKASPNADVTIEGKEIRINSADAEQAQKLAAELKAAAPDMVVMVDGKPFGEGESEAVPAEETSIESAVESSLDAANAAFDKLGDNPEAKDVATALSLQVINFAVNKSDIPNDNQAVLNRAVEVMKKVPDMKLMISGHTDSDGDAAYNKMLSQSRADAVKAYLVSQGIDASQLMTEGVGEEMPIVANDTKANKFRNRRIAFTVYDESTEGAVDKIEVVEDSVKAAE